jgi:signal transduction histidine kinase
MNGTSADLFKQNAFSLRRKSSETLYKIHDQLRLLAETDKILSSSLDFESTLRSVAHFAVPTYADWCSVDLTNEQKEISNVAITHGDPNKVDLALELKRLYPHHPNATRGIGLAIRTGKAQIYPHISRDILKELATDERHYEMLVELGVRSVIIVPMIARDRVLGAITFISSHDNYDETDKIFFHEVAKRAAIAVDHSLLFQKTARSLKIRDEFIAVASHELKTPLTSLRLQLQMAKRELSPERLSADFLSHLVHAFDFSLRQVNVLTTLIDDLLDVTRIQSGKLFLKLEEIDICDLAKEVLGRFSNEFKNSKCEVQTDFQPGARGFWEPHRIDQIFTNLIENAIKYAPQSKIKISVKIIDNHWASFSIEDNGCGIPKAKQAKLFDRFERATDSQSVGGLGLGLYITKSIIDAHKGTIEVESEEGVGTKFTVKLPRNCDTLLA